MITRSAAAVAFAMPGGEGSAAPRSRNRPVDLAHLSQQTLGDRALEQEVLQLFVQQALAVRDQIAEAGKRERLQLAHALKGSARGVGAFAIADCLAEIEKQPEDRPLIRKLSTLIDEVRDFIAAICR
jgi:HPt (histidine-containing phosphotransfer) domain-containing protein